MKPVSTETYIIFHCALSDLIFYLKGFWLKEISQGRPALLRGPVQSCSSDCMKESEKVDCDLNALNAGAETVQAGHRRLQRAGTIECVFTSVRAEC